MESQHCTQQPSPKQLEQCKSERYKIIQSTVKLYDDSYGFYLSWLWQLDKRDPEGDLLLLHSVLKQEPKIAESPGSKPKTCNTEESVEDLQVPFNPFSPGRVDIIARGLAHGREGIAEIE